MALARNTRTFTAVGTGNPLLFSGNVNFNITMINPGDAEITLFQSIDGTTWSNVIGKYNNSVQGKSFTPLSAGTSYRWDCTNIQPGKSVTVVVDGVQA